MFLYVVNTSFTSLMILRHIQARQAWGCSYILLDSCAENLIKIYIILDYIFLLQLNMLIVEKCIGKEFKYYFYISVNRPTF